MSRIISTILILAFVSSLLAGGYIFTECTADGEADRVEVRWITASEDKVKEFAVLRGRDVDNLGEIHRMNATGPGSQYTYIDNEVVFRSAHVIYYKVRAIDANGNILEEESVSAIPNVSGVFRTWGTIKAMFK